MSKHARFTYWTVSFGMIWLAFMLHAANAGPPFRTDDPGAGRLPALGILHLHERNACRRRHLRRRARRRIQLRPDPNGMVHIVVPTAFDSPVWRAHAIRVLATPSWVSSTDSSKRTRTAHAPIGIFPLVELPTGNQSHGLGAGHIRVFLPVWVQKNFGEWTTYGGGGYWINQDENLATRITGFPAGFSSGKITEKLTLGGEIFHQTADTIDGVDSTGFNLGGSYDFDEHNHLLFSAAGGFRTPLQPTYTPGI